MRLYLAVAVLVLAFVAYTEAQEETMEQKIANVGSQITEFGQQVAEQTKAALESFKNSETTQKIKSWADEYIEMIKNAVRPSN
uniref:Apolipoprotein C-I n=1 Tax=Sphaeramia orbicularis TaxID=375764 RepID=A0A672YEM5_9TELE